MTDPLIDAEDEAATPLTPEEREALIPTYITLRHELNEVEQIGIADADRWAFSRSRDVRYWIENETFAHDEIAIRCRYYGGLDEARQS